VGFPTEQCELIKKPKFKIRKTFNHAFKYNLSQKPVFQEIKILKNCCKKLKNKTFIDQTLRTQLRITKESTEKVYPSIQRQKYKDKK